MAISSNLESTSHLASYVERVVNLMDPSANVLLNMSIADAEAAVASGDPRRISEVDGQYAIAQKEGKLVRMARTIGRPMRYFLAKRQEGPC